MSEARGADQYTEAQRAQNWESLRGRAVEWPGVVNDVDDKGGTCRVYACCGSQTWTFDTAFDVPRDIGLKLVKSQRITVVGLLSDHGAFGYTLSSARLSGY